MRLFLSLAIIVVVPGEALPQNAPTFRDRRQAAFGALIEGRYDSAIELYGRAHEIWPARALPCYGLAATYSMKGDTKQALEWFQKSLALGDTGMSYRWVDQFLTNLCGEAAFAPMLEEALGTVRAQKPPSIQACAVTPNEHTLGIEGLRPFLRA